MTKRLILMRHAKSDWSSAAKGDHDRPLNGRGRLSATALGDWLRTKKIIPDQALISSATRTRETFARLGVACDTEFQKGLYLAEPNEMLASLRNASGDTVLMIGHNPGIAELAEILVAQPPEHSRFFDYPTGATLVVDFAIDGWDALKPSSGDVQEFVIPRELTG